MACACGKNRTVQRAAQQGIQFVYDYTAPDETLVSYGTPLEAKRALRRNGGGTIRRRTVVSDPAA